MSGWSHLPPLTSLQSEVRDELCAVYDRPLVCIASAQTDTEVSAAGVPYSTFATLNASSGLALGQYDQAPVKVIRFSSTELFEHL